MSNSCNVLIPRYNVWQNRCNVLIKSELQKFLFLIKILQSQTLLKRYTNVITIWAVKLSCQKISHVELKRCNVLAHLAHFWAVTINRALDSFSKASEPTLIISKAIFWELDTLHCCESLKLQNPSNNLKPTSLILI